MIGENVSMACGIEVLPDIYRSGVEIEWSGPNQEFEAYCTGGRFECRVAESDYVPRSVGFGTIVPPKIV